MDAAERMLLERSVLASMAKAALARSAAEALPVWAVVQRRRLERARRTYLLEADDDARLLLEDQERVAREIMEGLRRRPRVGILP